MSPPSAAGRKTAPHTIRAACEALARIAPPQLAQSWDNVGLLAGDPDAPLRRVLCCVDLTPAVVDEAIKGKYNLVVAYHPPIFKPITCIRADGHGTEALVFRCVAAGIAIYSTHTALDAAEGGTNDVLAELCGVKETEPLEYVDEPGREQCKLVTFVPSGQLDRVANALFEAGAGIIGDYTHCSYRLAGGGTFLGGESTTPAVGKRGRLEHVEEIRIETVVDTCNLAAVVRALRQAHPYEEPAFDIYPLLPAPVRGIGRMGMLPKPITLAQLARKLKKGVEAGHVLIVGPGNRSVSRAIIVVGAAGSLPLTKASPDEQTVIITGEIRHHDALTIERHGCCAIALGHWTSERPVLDSVAARLAEALPGAAIELSRADAEPFRMI